MRLSLVPDCVFAGEWTEEELRELIFEHQTGADLGMLSKFLSKPVGQIVHELVYLYFSICCAPVDFQAENHGRRWGSKEQRHLDELWSIGADVMTVSQKLKRSPYAICVRLITHLRASPPRGVLEALGLDPEEYPPSPRT